jgi:hypothetical protein
MKQMLFVTALVLYRCTQPMKSLVGFPAYRVQNLKMHSTQVAFFSG